MRGDGGMRGKVMIVGGGEDGGEGEERMGWGGRGSGGGIGVLGVGGGGGMWMWGCLCEMFGWELECVCRFVGWDFDYLLGVNMCGVGILVFFVCV